MKANKKKRSSKLPVILFGLLFLVGIALVLYPFVSTLLYEDAEEKAAVRYDEVTQNTSSLEPLRSAAHEYNETLIPLKLNRFKIAQELAGSDDTAVNMRTTTLGSGLSEQLDQKTRNILSNYKNILNVTGEGVMATVSIPTMDLSLPVYHGTSNEVLSEGVGHLEGSSFPADGTGVHSVLTAHSGLVGKRLFTDLEQMQLGDLFVVETIDGDFTYKVDQILVVEPDELEAIAIEENENYVTLLTCTPYGVNSHRLLVRGCQTTMATDEVPAPTAVETVLFQGQWFDDYLEALRFTGIIMLAFLIISLALFVRRNRKRIRLSTDSLPQAFQATSL